MDRNLDLVWQEQLATSGFVAGFVDAQTQWSQAGKNSVNSLKCRYINKFGDLDTTCFFCSYDEDFDAACTHCPGKSIDPSFSCNKPEYHYALCPVQFFNKILGLNRGREQPELERAWCDCLAQWGWIAGYVTAKGKGWRPCGVNSTARLKRRYASLYSADLGIKVKCWFCQYARAHRSDTVNLCSVCPGRLVDGEFSCYRDDYNYCKRPLEFFKKILCLNRERNR